MTKTPRHPVTYFMLKRQYLSFTSPGFPVKAVSRKFENTGPGQRRVTAIFLSKVSTARQENQPYKISELMEIIGTYCAW